MKVSGMCISGLVIFLLIFSSTVYAEGNLVGYWAFDADSEFEDSSGEDNHGTAENGAAIDGDGKFGGCAVFDGTDDYVECPSSDSLNPTGEITLMCWFSAAEGGLNEQKPLILKSFTAHADPYYQYGLFAIDKAGSPKGVYFYIAIDGTWHHDCAKNDAGYDYDEWHHLAGTYDGSEIKLYFDGEEVASETAPGEISSYDTPLLFGAYANLDKTDVYCFGGKIDEVAILDAALGANEIKRIMESGVRNTLLAVDSRGKLATLWGETKAAR